MSWTKDAHHAIRSLRQAPGFTTTAVLTLALGIGSAAAIFSVVDAVLMRPLPYRDADRLVHVAHDLRNRGVQDFPYSPGDFHDLRQLRSPFAQVEAVQTFQQVWAGEIDREAERIPTAFVTTGFFSMMGLQVAHGRDFTTADGAPLPPPPAAPGATTGAAPAPPPPPPPQTAILSHEFWQTRYGGNPAVVGSVQPIGAGPGRMEIVGVLAPGAELLFPPNIPNIQRHPSVWLANRTNFATGSRINVSLRVIGRLRDDISLPQAQSEIDTFAEDLKARFPIKQTSGYALRLVPMPQDLVADVQGVILVLMGAVAFVLLIACANVANLMMVRTAAREREMAVRTALGGTRGQLVRQLLVESLVLSLGASVLGIALAQAAVSGLRSLAPDNVPRLEAVGVNPQVVLFGIGMAVLSVVVFGLIPAIRGSRPNAIEVLRRSGRNESLGQGRWLRDSVVVAEVALSFVLLIGAGLMVRSFMSVYRADPGFDPAGVVTFQLANIFPVAPSPEARLGLVRDLTTRLRALPSVTDVTAASLMPLTGGEPLARYGKADALADASKFQQAHAVYVQPGFFAAMGTPVIDGREFSETDNLPAPRGIVIDALLAAKMFPGQRAVGQQLYARTAGDQPDAYEVIGVVGHQRHVSPASDGRETFYLPDARGGGAATARWAVRTSGDPAALRQTIHAAVTGLDRRLAIFEVATMEELVDRSAADTRFILWLFSIFGGVAVVLAAVGLYSVLSTVVRQRTGEIGVRMAFGAPVRSIFRLIVGHGLILSGVGVALGIVAAVALSRLLGATLINVSATDPVTYAVIGVTFLVVAAIACCVPALRAARLDPQSALRSE